MNAPFVSVALRCGGESIDAADLLSAFRGSQISQIWRRGEPAHRGGKSTTSGASCELDFGVEHSVGAPAVSLKFEPGLLKLVADLGVDLIVSDYLTDG